MRLRLSLIDVCWHAEASSELQHILACNSEAAAAILASTLQQPPEQQDGCGVPIKKSVVSGDYVVLQTPVITSPGSSANVTAKKAAKKPRSIKLQETCREGSPCSIKKTLSEASSEVSSEKAVCKAG